MLCVLSRRCAASSPIRSSVSAKRSTSVNMIAAARRPVFVVTPTFSQVRPSMLPSVAIQRGIGGCSTLHRWRHRDVAPEERNWREVPFAPDVLDAWDIGAGDPHDPDDPPRTRLRAALVAALTELIATRLTPRQRR